SLQEQPREEGRRRGQLSLEPGCPCRPRPDEVLSFLEYASLLGNAAVAGDVPPQEPAQGQFLPVPQPGATQRRVAWGRLEGALQLLPRLPGNLEAPCDVPGFSLQAT